MTRTVLSSLTADCLRLNLDNSRCSVNRIRTEQKCFKAVMPTCPQHIVDDVQVASFSAHFAAHLLNIGLGLGQSVDMSVASLSRSDVG